MKVGEQKLYFVVGHGEIPLDPVGEGGTGPAQWESCCVTAPAGGVQLGKYKVTSGRMRAFMERTGGNVRQFIRDARAAGKIPAGATMPAAYDAFLPTAMEGCDQTGTCTAEEISDAVSPYAGGGAPFVGVWSSAYRHLGGMNIGFLDGHQKWYDASEVTPEMILSGWK